MLLGHIMSEKGVLVDPAKIKAVMNWKQDPAKIKAVMNWKQPKIWLRLEAS